MFVPVHEITTPTEIIGVNLAILIQNKDLTAYDQNNNFQPVDWKKKEADFIEIQNLSQAPGKKFIKKRWNDRHGNSRLTDKEVDQVRIVVSDTYRDSSGIEQPTPRVKEDKLLLDLRNERKQTAIPVSQWLEIKGEWGPKQMAPVALAAWYDKKELQQALDILEDKPPYLIQDHPYHCPELAVLVEAWMAFYEDRTAKLVEGYPQRETFKDWMVKWVETNSPELDIISDNLLGTNAYLLKTLNGKRDLMKKLYDEYFNKN